ncbi:MAG: SCO family protein [Gammaproteobacteria bacterium]|nr:SCO family protein [Gammaproteobacteria bacterium]
MHIKKVHGNSNTIQVIFLTLAMALWLGANLAGCTDQRHPPQISGTLLPEPKPLEPFQLTDHKGKRFDKENTKGYWTFIFFGYTSCPDVCPATLFQFKQIASRLEKTGVAAQNTQFVLVSVDPERDSEKHLEKYIHYYHKDFIALTGSHEQIKALASQLGIFYMRNISQNDGNSSENYLIDHSAAIMLLDPDSKLHALFGAPHSAEKITADFLKIREHFEN